MAKGKDLIVSGFVGMNTGQIENCSAKMHMNLKKGQSGFCGVNSGEIESSYSDCRYKGKKDVIGFCKNTKGVQNCFFVMSGKQKGEQFSDKTYAVAKEEVKSKFSKTGSWSDKKSWKFEGDEPVMNQYVFEESLEEAEHTISITNEQELLDIITKVNEGLDEYSYASISLECDLNLKGKKITPIGKSEVTPFYGVFNGNGFAIKNFIISAKKEEASGLFGYIKDGIVENLSVDCIVHGGKYAGAIAGVNDGGRILGCQAAVHGDAQYCFGGLVGKNSGFIENSGCIGKAQKPFHPVMIASSVGGMAVIGAAVIIFLLMPGHGKNGLRYPAVPVSEEAVPIKGDHDKSETGGNSVVYQLETELAAKSGDGEVTVDFKNPGKSNHNIVVMLQISDEELMNKIGKTGRTEEEQKKLENTEGYSASENRVIIAESGSIPPGYELDTLQLKSLEDGTYLPKGTYQAIVYLVLYDASTNEQAMINSQTPVTLKVKG